MIRPISGIEKTHKPAMAATPKTIFKTIGEYISAFPPEAGYMLEKIRKIIKEVEPEAEEVISYNMPAFKFHGILVYFAAHKHHIGFYPASSKVIEFFKSDLENYETSKGTIRFPFGKPLPVRLIKKIIHYRVIGNLERRAAKMKKNR